MDRSDYAYDPQDERRAALDAGRFDSQYDQGVGLADIPLTQPGDQQWAYQQSRRGGIQ